MIERQDVVDDDLFKAPKILTKDFLEFYNVLLDISKISREIKIPGSGGGVTPQNNGDSVKKQREETEKLTAQQKELAKVQAQIATLTARDTEEYRKQAKELTGLKQQLKEKTALGERDALTVNKQNASLTELRAALNANRAAHAKLTTEEQRASVEGQHLLKVIQDQDTAVKDLAGSTGDHTDNVGDYKGKMKELRNELKLAKDEMVGIAAALGTDSVEFEQAAAKAGDLKNEIGDLEANVKAVSGSKFENVGTALGLVGQKLKALDFKGAAAAATQLVAATKQLTFGAAIAGIGQFGKTMLSLAKALLLNPIFQIAAVIYGIVTAVNKLKDSSPLLTKAFDAIGSAIDYVIDRGKEFLDWIGLTTFALDEQAEKIIDNAKKRIEATKIAADQEIKIAQANAQRTVELEIKKNKDVIKAATDGLGELFEIQKRYGKLNDEQQKVWDEYVAIIAQANTEIQSIQAAEREREIQDAQKLNSYLINEETKRQKEIVDNERKSVDDRINASEKLDDLRRKAAKHERDTALSDDNLTASGRRAIWAKYQQDLSDITKQGVNERQKITLDEVKRYQEEIAKRITAEKKVINEQAQARQNAILADIDATKKAALAGAISAEEADKIITEKKKRYADEQVKVQIDALKKILNIRDLSAEEEAEIEKEIAKLKSELTEAEFAQLNRLEKKRSEALTNTEKDLLKLQEAFNNFSGAIGNLFASFTERRLMQIDKESAASEEALENQLEREDKAVARRLANETLTDEQKKQIEEASAERKEALEKAEEARQEAFEARRRREIRKQAIYEKAVALAQAVIAGALAVVKALPLIPLAIAAGALAAIQIAAIATRPIPAAEKGIKNHKGGPIIAGEKGSELVEMPGNKYALTDSTAGLYDFPAGTNIYPADSDRTLRAIAMNSLSSRTERKPIPSYDYARLEKGLSRINKTIMGKPSVIVEGQITGSIQNHTRIKYLNTFRNKAA
jgi:hypothetical protein